MQKMSSLNTKFKLVIFFIILNTLNSIYFSQSSSPIESWEQKADSLILCAKSQLGVPYQWATSKPGISFDCSGFTYYVYTKFNIESSRRSGYYKNYGKSIPLSKSRKGDCILFTGAQNDDKSIGHIGIVVSNEKDKLNFIHCSSSSRHFGVVITEYYSSNYPRRFIEIRRIF